MYIPTLYLVKKSMKKLIYILFALVFLACSSDHYFSKAEKLAEKGKYAEAIIFLDRAIERNPKNFHALNNRAVNKSILGDYNGAIEDYSKIIQIDSSNILAHLNRGRNKVRVGDYQGAIEDFDRAIRIKGGENLWIEWSNSPFLGINNEFDATMEEIRFERGFARYNMGSLETALEDFMFCIQRNFELSTSYFMAGLIYIAYGNIAEACKMLNRSKIHGNLYAQKMINEYC